MNNPSLFSIRASLFAWLGLLIALLTTISANATSPVEHEQIEGPFEDGSDVTSLCLECHEQQAKDFMQTTHWTWSTLQEVPGKGKVFTGKKHAINNFCIGVASNLSKCTECHAGYGWNNQDYDFEDASHVDCLVCHDTTGEYRRIAGVGGVVDLTVDLEHVARNVGSPARQNCGSCHFYGGGGNAVKHGDLESTLVDADASLDIHMDRNGLDFPCQNCHVTERHQIPGHTMAASPAGKNAVSCSDCHSGEFHSKPILDHHAKSVACQSCHIPTYAKAEPTKMNWDWSKAAVESAARLNEQGETVYVPYKGEFVWGKDIQPVYAWFNGSSGIHTWGDKINPGQETVLNWPIGAKSDSDAKIYPFKLHRGKQIYDSENDYLINPHLTGSTGFWESLDWDLAAREGMAARNLPYSGHYAFTDTLMYWRLNHMVEPAKNALVCGDCHGQQGNRLDWEALGYSADPMFEAGQARYPLTQ